MVSAAVFAGLTGMVISEHLPLPHDMDPARHLSMCPTEVEDHFNDIATYASRVKGLEVIAGAEVDWLPDRPEHMHAEIDRARALGARVFIGSIHFLDEWAFDNPHDLAGWELRDVDDVWERYFTQWCEAAGSGLFDVMAHPDLPKKFGHRPSSDPAPLFEDAAVAARDAGVAIEVSTAGLHKPVGELYPSARLLEAFCARGVPATVASDAHAPDEVGRDIDVAYEAMVRAGYKRVAFPQGERSWRWIEL
jgi:histidinol-phosphatase (PHP family)